MMGRERRSCRARRHTTTCRQFRKSLFVGCGGGTHGCQIAIARFLARMCLALWASGLGPRYATLQNWLSGNLGGTTNSLSFRHFSRVRLRPSASADPIASIHPPHPHRTNRGEESRARWMAEKIICSFAFALRSRRRTLSHVAPLYSHFIYRTLQRKYVDK